MPFTGRPYCCWSFSTEARVSGVKTLRVRGKKNVRDRFWVGRVVRNGPSNDQRCSLRRWTSPGRPGGGGAGGGARVGRGRGSFARRGNRGRIRDGSGRTPVACWRPSMPSATRSFCTASTSRPVVPSYKSRSRGISRPPGAVYGDVRVLGDGFQLLGVPLGPAAAARADRRATTARCRNGAIPERASRAFGSLCRIALLAPVNAGAAESDAMVRTLGRRRRPRLFFSRGSAAQRPCLPLPRAGLVHVADSNLGSIASNAPNNSFI